jgi:hypothetical protein
MQLWKEWFRCVRQLRSACSRTRSFFWLVTVLVGLSTRLELAGVTSFVRSLGLAPAAYRRLLYLFHSPAVSLDRLTALWVRLVPTLCSPYKAGPFLVCIADGIKAPKEGRLMPAVRSLHQSADSNSKPPFIMGHSFQAMSLLVRSPSGHVASVPLAARIHEGLVWSNRDQRTLLDRLVGMFLGLAGSLDEKVILLADAYYASGKVIRPLLREGHHLVTRARMNSVAYLPPNGQSGRRRRGRPRIYGEKVRLRDLIAEKGLLMTAPSPLARDTHSISYGCFDLLWRPVGHLVRFVVVKHPRRGMIILMTTHMDLDPLEVIALYSHRFKIETGFRHAIHVLGAYGYHFWMEAMEPIRRRSKNQYLHMRSEKYRNAVVRKMKAYHLHVQLGCIAQGLLIHLAINHGELVWKQFRSWLRTMDPARPPSELVVMYSLRDSLPEFLDGGGEDEELRIFWRDYRPSDTARDLKMAG